MSPFPAPVQRPSLSAAHRLPLPFLPTLASWRKLARQHANPPWTDPPPAGCVGLTRLPSFRRHFPNRHYLGVEGGGATGTVTKGRLPAVSDPLKFSGTFASPLRARRPCVPFHKPGNDDRSEPCAALAPVRRCCRAACLAAACASGSSSWIPAHVRGRGGPCRLRGSWEETTHGRIAGYGSDLNAKLKRSCGRKGLDLSRCCDASSPRRHLR